MQNPSPPKSRITKPRIVLPSAVLLKTRPSPVKALSPSRMIAGRLPLAAKLSSVVASIVTVPVIVGKADESVIVWVPVPEMLNSIESAPILALASRIACRNEPAPEAFGIGYRVGRKRV